MHRSRSHLPLSYFTALCCSWIIGDPPVVNELGFIGMNTRAPLPGSCGWPMRSALRATTTPFTYSRPGLARHRIRTGTTTSPLPARAARERHQVPIAEVPNAGPAVDHPTQNEQHEQRTRTINRDIEESQPDLGDLRSATQELRYGWARSRSTTGGLSRTGDVKSVYSRAEQRAWRSKAGAAPSPSVGRRH